MKWTTSRAEGAMCWHLFTELAATVFRAQSALSGRADQLMPAGLTVARWQVLRAAARLEGTATVPALARALSLSRQAVQKQVDLMREKKLVALKENPAHRRSPIVVLTKQGHQALLAATMRWNWIAQSLGESLDSSRLQKTQEMLQEIITGLSQSEADTTEE